MSFRVVRQSKFRHVFGKEHKKENCYDGIKVSDHAWDSPMISVNTKYLAVIEKALGGGAFMVIPVTKTGRLELNHPKVNGHKETVLDIQWSPIHENVIASCSEDLSVKVWEIPAGGLTEDLKDPVASLEGHQRRVGYVEWHPTCDSILCSAGHDYVVMVWKLDKSMENGGCALQEITCHTDVINSVAWNMDGSLLATTCKDKVLRVLDPRTGNVIAEKPKAHEGGKAARVKFFTKSNMLFTVGFSRSSERQYAIWDSKNIAKPLKLEMIDQASSVMYLHFDEDTNMMFVGGKGDGNIRYFEVQEASPYAYYVSEFKSQNPQRGLAFMPKKSMNVSECEIARCFKSDIKGSVTVISFNVPRKSSQFQEDIFPPTREPVSTVTADEWMGGKNGEIRLISMKDGSKKGSAAPSMAASGSGSAAAGSSSGSSGAPTDVASLTKAYHDHVAEIKELKAKLGKMEIDLRKAQGK
eukprot:m.331632 g.331632  ORF g.331632 m.331632 type:complete len:468 (+) comp16770_c0_seq1:2765-4168(+)